MCATSYEGLDSAEFSRPRYLSAPRFDVDSIRREVFGGGLTVYRWLSNVAVILLLTCAHGLAKEFELTPAGGLGPPIDPNIRVVFDSPDDWVISNKTNPSSGFKRVFVPKGNAGEDHSDLYLSIEARVAGESDPGTSDLSDPRMSQTASNMEEFSSIDHIQRIDAEMNRSFTIWGLHSQPRYGKAYTSYLVLLHYKHVGVEVCLRTGDTQKLSTYLAVLKTVARSVRFNDNARK